VVLLAVLVTRNRKRSLLLVVLPVVLVTRNRKRSLLLVALLAVPVTRSNFHRNGIPVGDRQGCFCCQLTNFTNT